MITCFNTLKKQVWIFMTDGQKLALILSKMTDTENVTGCIPDPPPYGLILVVTGLRCYNNV